MGASIKRNVRCLVCVCALVFGSSEIENHEWCLGKTIVNVNRRSPCERCGELVL